MRGMTIGELWRLIAERWQHEVVRNGGHHRPGPLGSTIPYEIEESQ